MGTDWTEYKADTEVDKWPTDNNKTDLLSFFGALRLCLFLCLCPFSLPPFFIEPLFSCVVRCCGCSFDYM